MKNEEFVDVFIFRQKNKRNIFFKSSYFQNFITNSNSPLLVKKFQLYHKEYHKKNGSKSKEAKTPHSDFAKGEERQPAKKSRPQFRTEKRRSRARRKEAQAV